MMGKPSTPALRCAIYTRKSSDEGLEQDFNSLHAQREACEAYILSQAGEGWKCLKALYDDGGFSGGSMDRPGLKQLLADIAAGKIDVVVVYKVDRLTRSLGDFARIVEIFDQRAVSFVSVTQSFNTTTSMGRLTLNVLLSFAQFEREVTGERIRDKIAASKAKGMWMGGVVPLGYDPKGRTLEVNQAEARQVRAIFMRYLELKSVAKLKDELAAKGVGAKQRTTRDGRTSGGGPMNRGALYHLLSNPLYIGRIRHKHETYDGLHLPIVPTDVFNKVQALLAENRHERAKPSKPKLASPLTGKLFAEGGEPLSPTISHGKSGRKYRYYVSSRLQRGEASTGKIDRLPAPALEAFALERVGRWCGLRQPSWEEVLRRLARIEISDDGAVFRFSFEHLRLGHDDGAETLRKVSSRLNDEERAWITDAGDIAVSLQFRLVFRGGRTWLFGAGPAVAGERRRPDKALIGGLRRAHQIARAHNLSPLQTAGEAANGTGISDTYERKLANLAFLAPDIQIAILEGRQPPSLTLQALIDASMPASWPDQRKLIADLSL
jgi:DNA invertase Pin-like site-specific DNA recombinase